MTTETQKTIDESKQGQATVVKPLVKTGRKVYLESYGCAMNFSDSEIVASILSENGYITTRDEFEANIILLNTCSIRDKAEETIRKRLTNFKNRKTKRSGLIVGVLGCMAERLKTTLLEEEQLVDLVVGPDAYRDLPKLIKEVDSGQKLEAKFHSKKSTQSGIRGRMVFG